MSSLPPLGLTGPNSAGKGVTAERLVEHHGYHAISLSDVLRDEARRRGQEPVRGVLIPLGTELRRLHGPGALAEMVVERLEPPALIDSIRNPAEVEVLRRLVPGFVLVALGAPLAVRFERSLARQREGDPETVEEFRRREAQENTRDPAAQQLTATAALADHVLDNSGDLDELHRRVDHLVARLAEAER